MTSLETENLATRTRVHGRTAGLAPLEHREPPELHVLGGDEARDHASALAIIGGGATVGALMAAGFRPRAWGRSRGAPARRVA